MEDAFKPEWRDPNSATYSISYFYIINLSKMQYVLYIILYIQRSDMKLYKMFALQKHISDERLYTFRTILVMKFLLGDRFL